MDLNSKSCNNARKYECAFILNCRVHCFHLGDHIRYQIAQSSLAISWMLLFAKTCKSKRKTHDSLKVQLLEQEKEYLTSQQKEYISI
jgi:hypothetical protein